MQMPINFRIDKLWFIHTSCQHKKGTKAKILINKKARHREIYIQIQIQTKYLIAIKPREWLITSRYEDAVLIEKGIMSAQNILHLDLGGPDRFMYLLSSNV